MPFCKPSCFCLCCNLPNCTCSMIRCFVQHNSVCHVFLLPFCFAVLFSYVFILTISSPNKKVTKKSICHIFTCQIDFFLFFIHFTQDLIVSSSYNSDGIADTKVPLPSLVVCFSLTQHPLNSHINRPLTIHLQQKT